MQHEDVIVFLGPSLAIAEARQVLDADYRPPASRGDFYRATKANPRAILLIDGAFESNAAVLHNEILWALSKGIYVWGAASMGALRAAELSSFGMIGCGKIFEAYRGGVLERDDAVAVVHGPAELGYPLLSMALVDVWATLDRVYGLGLLSVHEHELLRNIAGGIFYKRLCIETLIETALNVGFPEQQAHLLRQHWNSHGVFSQKREDAVEVLRAVVDGVGLSTERIPSTFFFERTSAWEKLIAEQDEHDINMTPEDLVFSTTELAAIGLALAEKEAQRRGFMLGRAEFESTARQFRHQNELRTFSDVKRWLQVGKLDHNDYVGIIEDEFVLAPSRGLMQGRVRSLTSRVNRLQRSSVASKLSK